jgi:hypothetical protein
VAIIAVLARAGTQLLMSGIELNYVRKGAKEPPAQAWLVSQ